MVPTVEAIRLDPARLTIGIACVIFAAIPLLITPHVSPNAMAILCDDTTIKYPFHKSTVPSWLLFFVGYLSAFCIFLGMGLVAQYRFSYIQPGQRPRVYYIFQRIVPRAVVDLLRGYATYMFGTFLTMSMTDIIKVLVGRPRPNFWHVCAPTFVINGTRVDSCQPGTFFESYECRNEVAHEIRESRLSFVSGHTSFAFYCATYLACYLERKFRPVELPCLCLLLQVLLMFSAVLVGLSRIVDNKHHWSDVVCGGILGTIVGYYTEQLNEADLFGRGVVVEYNAEDVEVGGIDNEHKSRNQDSGIEMVKVNGVESEQIRLLSPTNGSNNINSTAGAATRTYSTTTDTNVDDNPAPPPPYETVVLQQPQLLLVTSVLPAQQQLNSVSPLTQAVSGSTDLSQQNVA